MDIGYLQYTGADGWCWFLESAGLQPSLLGPSSCHFRLVQMHQTPSKPAQALLLNGSVSFAYLYA